MKNYIQPGTVITVPAPAGGAVSGNAYLVGSMFGVASGDAAAGADLELQLEGVFTLPKATGAAWAVGDALYWDAVNSNLTKTAAGNKLVGNAGAAAAAGDASGALRLIGSPVT